MALWKLTPAAEPNDDRWQGRPIWNELIVEAPSAAFARQYAAEWELRHTLPQVGNESPSPKSGFIDEKLYWVRRVPAEQALNLPTHSNGGSPVLRAIER